MIVRKPVFVSFLRFLSLAALLLAAGLALPAAVQADCGPRVDGPVTVVGAVVLDDAGQPLQDRAALSGTGVRLADGTALADGAAVPLNTSLAGGLIANAGAHTTVLTFSNGQSVTLAAGEVVAVGNAKCECRCTCKTSTGATHGANFPCDSNADKCNYDGNICQWSEGGTTHTGTYTGCIKVWVISS